MLYEYEFDDFYVRHAIDEYPDPKNFSMHIHKVCEIYFFISGDVRYRIEGSGYLLDENSLLIMRPAEAHSPNILSPKRYERFAAYFPIGFIESIDPEGRLVRMFREKQLGKNNLFTSAEIDTKLIKSLFFKMVEDGDDYEKQLTIKTHLIYILDMLMRAYRGREDAPDHTSKNVAIRMVAYVNEHLFENITVPEIARHFYLSPSQFSRIFKQATGASPWEYITKKRLTAVNERINKGEAARAAAEECGFGDYSSFYRAYTKHFGSSPSQDAARRGDFYVK